MIGKRKLFTETVRERIIAILATTGGITGGFYGGIIYGDIYEGVINYSYKFSLFGAFIGIILALSVCGTSSPYKNRNFFERLLSNIFSVIGNTLFGATIGGFFGAFLQHPFFVKLYTRDIYNSIIGINSNIGDGILIGGIAGAIGCTIGAVIDTIFAFIFDIVLRFTQKQQYKYIQPAEKAPEKPEAVTKTEATAK
ncbi:MAG: hypothetical protein HY934_08185 [Candidatus Firestonebacteria bacterium]|nr:hypothetical protein [Candidatus Firestonebacteria bacterium]